MELLPWRNPYPMVITFTVYTPLSLAPPSSLPVALKASKPEMVEGKGPADRQNVRVKG